MLWNVEKPKNESDKIKEYRKGSKSREKLKRKLEKIKKRDPLEIPLIIDGNEVKTGKIHEIKCPHHRDLTLAKAHMARPQELDQAIESLLSSKDEWENKDWFHRVSVFKKAASLLSGSKRIENIATMMMNHSKNPYEAEIDLAELVDFWKFNSYFAEKIFKEQPDQKEDQSNRFDWRPLEGFILAIPPFNFYSIAGNLPTAPAIVGNVSLWKPSRNVILSNYKIMQILLEAGLPDGVINFVPFSSENSERVIKHRELAGIHFTGSYEVLTKLKNQVNSNLDTYKNFPRIIGEAGGKDFIFMHKSADPENVSNNLIRGAFNYQGQKCSAASRAYIPKSKFQTIKKKITKRLDGLETGPVENLNNYMGAVIDKSAYEKIKGYIEHAQKTQEHEMIYGGDYHNDNGWYIEPTLVRTTDPKSKLMTEEIFGPVLTIYLYDQDQYEETLKICDDTSPYALTGSIFAKDRYAIQKAEKELRYSAGNFYINDKPTAAEVNRQPFGGARRSGTNDKSGSWLNITRWLTPRSIKENYKPINEWKRPFQK